MLTEGSTLVQYVDDLLICSTSEVNCKKDTLTLLRVLAAKSHEVPKAKLQLCETQVTYLGHVLSGTSGRLSTDRVQAILNVPKLKTKKEMKRFLGMAGNCRQWVPDYAVLVRPLLDMILDKVPEPVEWTQ